MNYENDIIRQINYLQQCLSQDKKPLGLFIGAGCPVSIKVKSSNGESPLIPDIEGITKVVRDKLSKSKDYRELFKKVEDQITGDGKKDPNVEDFLGHVRALRAVVGKDAVRGLSAENLDVLDSEICGIIHELSNKELPDIDTPYNHMAGWIEATLRDMPVEIFTTNYDLLVEQSFEGLNVPYFDGFAGGCKPFFDLRAMEEDKLPPRWARIWKIHGSINWYQNSIKGVFRGGTKERGSKRVVSGRFKIPRVAGTS